MRRRSVYGSIALAVLVVALANVAGATSPPPPADMVSWWRGEADATDSVGSNDGTLSNGAAAGAAGQVGNAFTFEPDGDVLSIGNPASLQFGTGDFTVEAWVRFDAVPADDDDLIRKMTASNVQGWMLIRQSDGRFWMCLGGGIGNACGNGLFTVFSTTVPTTGTWYHVAGVLSGGTLNLYVNGALEDSQVLDAGASNDDSASLEIGGGSTGPFDGQLDEITIYDRALSAAEIAGIHQAGSEGKSATVGPCTVTGTAARDLLTGTTGVDVMCGLAGRDLVDALSGDDFLSGNAGADKLLGRKGNDWLLGGSGVDNLRGGFGHDEIHADDGVADTVEGGSGNDDCYVDGLDAPTGCETVIVVP